MHPPLAAPAPPAEAPTVSDEPRDKPWIWLPAAIPAVAMALVCLPFADHRSLWLDEAVSWEQSTISWSSLATNLQKQDLVFAPYYGFLHLWLHVSQSAGWLRTPSAIAGIVTVWIVGALGHRLWGNRAVGLVAALLLAAHPSFVAWSLQARPYTLATLMVATSAWQLSEAGRTGRTRHWVCYTLATAAGGYLHLFTLLMLPVHVLALIAGGRLDRRAMAALGSVVVLSLPLSLTVSQSAQVAWIGPLTWSNVADALTFVTITRVLAALLLLGVIGLAAQATQGPQARFAVVLCLGWSIFPLSILLAVSTVHPIFQDRYIVFVLPGLCLAAAGGWGAFFSLILDVKARTAALICAAALASWAVPLADTLQSPFYIDDYKALDAFLRTDPTAQRIVASPPWVATGVAYYERDRSQAAQWRRLANGMGTVAVLGSTGSISPGTIKCSHIRLLLRSDLSEATAMAATQGCQPGAVVRFGYLSVITLSN